MANRSMVQNDTYPPIDATVRATDPADGVLKPLDLSAAVSLRWLMRPKAGSGLLSSVPSRLAGTGRIRYTPVAADTAVTGTYGIQVEVTWSAGVVQTFPLDDTLTITEDFG